MLVTYRFDKSQQLLDEEGQLHMSGVGGVETRLAPSVQRKTVFCRASVEGLSLIVDPYHQGDPENSGLCRVFFVAA